MIKHFLGPPSSFLIFGHDIGVLGLSFSTIKSSNYKGFTNDSVKIYFLHVIYYLIHTVCD